MMEGLVFPLEKAMLIIEKEGSSIKMPVLFNPEQYNISRSVNFAKTQVPGTDNQIMQFINGQQNTLSLSLYFDTLNPYVPLETECDVNVLTRPIMDALCIDGKLHTSPKTTFCWGSFSFCGVMVRATQTFTMFLPSGMPVRAKIDLTFEYAGSGELAKKKSPFESPDRTKVRVLEDEGGLWRLSHAEYGDAGEWRKIADANNIYNPRKCSAGTMLKVPPL